MMYKKLKLWRKLHSATMKGRSLSFLNTIMWEISINNIRIAINYIDSFRYSHHDYLVLELAGRNLHEFFYENREIPYSMSFIRSVTKQLLTFLSFFHGQGLIHCDIKPENILLEDDAYKIELVNDMNCANPHSVVVCCCFIII